MLIEKLQVPVWRLISPKGLKSQFGRNEPTKILGLILRISGFTEHSSWYFWKVARLLPMTITLNTYCHCQHSWNLSLILTHSLWSTLVKREENIYLLPLQFCSSDLSPQSLSPSHRYLVGIHFPLGHWCFRPLDPRHPDVNFINAL